MKTTDPDAPNMNRPEPQKDLRESKGCLFLSILFLAGIWAGTAYMIFKLVNQNAQ